jgi:hypothetical protein
MNEEFDFEDADIINAMDSVDWHAITKEDAALFGKSVNFYRSTIDVKDRMIMNKGEHFYGMVFAIAFFVLGSLFAWSHTFMMGVMIWVPIINYAVATFRTRLCKGLLREQKAILLDEIQNLAIKHPRQTSADLERLMKLFEENRVDSSIKEKKI